MGSELKDRSRTETPRTKHESTDEKAYLNDMSKLVEQLSNHVQITVIYEEISEGLLKC